MAVTSDVEMTITDHLEELRWRMLKSLAAILFGMIAVWGWSSEMLSFLAKPVGNLVFVAPTEAFFTRMKVSLFGGALLALPIVLHQVWAFTACAMSPQFRRYATFIVPFSYVFFLAGTALSIFVVTPSAITFLIGYGSTQVAPMLTVGHYVEFVTTLALAFGLVFQLPIALLFFHRAGLIGRASLVEKRRTIYFASFVLAAFLTPPDVISQVALGLPIIILFEASLFAMRWTGDGDAS
ncbi:MAG: twin-arginine translocase subunit TatC [Elusimicrobia bacterium]|nr:MAG: twin-arginine translocase subunit TatC [Elusimicrobiota bacterium]